QRAKMSAVLSKSDIRRLLEQKPPLVEGYLNLSQQLQPNGFDLTLRDIALFQNAGQMGAENTERRLPDLAPLIFGSDGFMDLIPGSYLITYNEIVHLPTTVMALGRPRSSLLRCGVNIGTAVWDAGYEGRSQSLMVVCNAQGFRVQKNARMMQLVFFRLTSETDGYSGTYQGENIT
ncbi:MAG: deoxyuridine 5'-triphosphate nucleotidohydrolase, partial [Dehalococcoidales bacterium]|nr:deoxyuridine 5'-triphosphate nucleotidohydrolase [Dehalococcoidales bacterium]